MKTAKHLYEKIIDDENISLAIVAASKHKKHRKDVQKAIWMDEKGNFHAYDEYVKHIKYVIEHYEPKPGRRKIINDGFRQKKRIILVPTYENCCVHHAIFQILAPADDMVRKKGYQRVVNRGQYIYSCASIPERGTHYGKRTVEKWMQTDFKNTKYCLKFDIKKFFPSIPLDKLKAKLRNDIKDERALALLFKIIDIQKVGLPIGYYSSQWLANYYLRDMDNAIIAAMGKRPCRYMRYMDDENIFASSKRFLRKVQAIVEKQLEKDGLTLKGNYQIFDTWSRTVDFMGFQFFHNRTTIRRSVYYRASRKAKKLWKKDKITSHDASSMLSYLAYFKHTDTRKAYEEHIKPFIPQARLLKKKARRTNDQLFKNIKHIDRRISADI